MRDYAYGRCGAGAGEKSGRGNCGGKISRGAARNSVGRKRSAGYGRDSDHVWCGVLPESRAERRCSGSEAFECGGCGDDCEVEFGFAGAERYLVWRADGESVVAGRRSVGIERGTRRSDGGGTGWIRDWKRNGRKHREPEHAMRRDGIAANVWTGAAHGRDDAVLV